MGGVEGGWVVGDGLGRWVDGGWRILWVGTGKTVGLWKGKREKSVWGRHWAQRLLGFLGKEYVSCAHGRIGCGHHGGAEAIILSLSMKPPLKRIPLPLSR